MEPTKRRGAKGLAWRLVGSLAIALGAGGWALHGMETDHLERVEQRLQAVSRASVGALRQWRARQLQHAQRWAHDPTIRAHVLALTNSPRRDPDSLLRHDAQHALRKELRPALEREGYRGMFVIARDGLNLASMRDSNLGVPTLLHSQPEVLRTLWSGEATVSRPQRTDVPLGLGERDDAPTMFAAAPVRDDRGNVVAALTFRIAPTATLSELFEVARLGKTGETYLVDAHGRLITRSRFERELRAAGHLEEGQSSIFHVPVTVGANGQRPTHAVHQLLQGRSGIDAEGYENYLGQRVVGMWIHDPGLGAGLVTEQHAREAHAPLRETRTLALVAMLAITLAGFGLAYTQWRTWQRTASWARALSRSRELERKAARNARLNELSLREAQKLSRMGSGVADLERDTVRWSPEARDILDENLPTATAYLVDLAQLFRPDDRARVRSSIEPWLRAPRPV